MEKIITIIIPTYNMEKYLDKCLTSLIMEDKELMKHVEVLVVIDGSKDRSSEIAHTYQSKYPETFRVIDKENGNYGSCINRGLLEAKGKYIKILDADDSFDTKAYELFIRQLERVPTVDVVFTGFVTETETGEQLQEFKRPFELDKVLCWDNILMSVSDMDFHTAMHEITYRTQLLRDINYFQTEGISYTDQEWILYPFAKANDFICLDHCVYHYLVGREGQTMDVNILVKSAPALLQIATRMLYYAKESNSNLHEPQQAYLKGIIYWMCRRIYSTCLLSKTEGVNLRELNTFDEKLKSLDLDIYNKLDDARVTIFYIKYKYIKKWRNSQNHFNLPLSLKCLIKVRR